MYKPFLFRIAISALATAAFAQGLLPYTISLTKTSFAAFLIFGTAPALILLVVDGLAMLPKEQTLLQVQSPLLSPTSPPAAYPSSL
jgi:hypothetical protein